MKYEWSEQGVKMDKTLAFMSFLAGVLAALVWLNQTKPLRKERKTEQESAEKAKPYLRIDKSLEQAVGQ